MNVLGTVGGRSSLCLLLGMGEIPHGLSHLLIADAGCLGVLGMLNGFRPCEKVGGGQLEGDQAGQEDQGSRCEPPPVSCSRASG